MVPCLQLKQFVWVGP